MKKLIIETARELGIILVLWVVITAVITGEYPSWGILAWVSVGWVLVAVTREAAARAWRDRRAT